MRIEIVAFSLLVPWTGIILADIIQRREDWLVGCRDKVNCLHVEPGSMGGLPSVGGLS